MKSLFLTTALALVLSSCETTNSNSTASNVVSPTPTKPAVEKKETASTGVKPYTRSTCIVTGEKLDSKGMVITEVYKGHEFKMCCEACHIAFKMDKEFYLAKL